jgi:integrase
VISSKSKESPLFDFPYAALLFGCAFPSTSNQEKKHIHDKMFHSQFHNHAPTAPRPIVSIFAELNQRRAFSLDEVRRVLKQCDIAGGEWPGLMLTAIYSGQRLGDIAQLTWQQVDLPKKTIAFLVLSMK